MMSTILFSGEKTQGPLGTVSIMSSSGPTVVMTEDEYDETVSRLFPRHGEQFDGSRIKEFHRRVLKELNVDISPNDK